MKFLYVLALLPFFLATHLAHAKGVIVDPPKEDALSFPWGDYIRDAAVPEATTQLLVTIHVGTRINSFQVKIDHCGDGLQAVELKVEKAPVTVESFGLRFTDGTTRDFKVNQTFASGTDSGWLDMRVFRSLDPRCPAAIYARAQSTGDATVLIYGNLR